MPKKNGTPESNGSGVKATKPETSSSAAPTLVPQKNGGALYSGGKPGNKGGGRPKERVRRKALKLTNKAINELGRMLDRHAATVEKITNGQPVEKMDLFHLMKANDVARVTEVGGKIGLEEKQGPGVVIPVQIIIRREA